MMDNSEHKGWASPSVAAETRRALLALLGGCALAANGVFLPADDADDAAAREGALAREAVIWLDPFDFDSVDLEQAGALAFSTDLRQDNSLSTPKGKVTRLVKRNEKTIWLAVDLT
jgi:hypothetical protein